MKYNPQKHHRRSIRLKGYDYSKEGLYFITICCHNRECLFGKIENDEMILNDAGKFANECWMEIPKHFPNAVLHEHIVMPNHVHGIIELTQNNVDNIGAENFLHDNYDVVANVGVENFQPLPPKPPQNDKIKRNKFQKMIPRSIGSIVKGFKIGVTKWFRDNAGTFGVENLQPPLENFQPLPPQPQKQSTKQPVWQRNYHEHIIRNEQSYHNISNYITNNPAKWYEDKFHKK